MPINPGERYPQPSRPSKAAAAIQTTASKHQTALAAIVAFVLGVIFGAK